MTHSFLRARHFLHIRHFALSFVTSAALALTAISPSQAAAKIQHLTSPGGIEVWFVQDATVPLIAMEYSFAGGSAQDPKDKPGVANLVGDLLDEGSGDLDSKTFHERLDRRAIELSFSATRDYFRGSLRMLRDNKDEAFELLRMSLTSATPKSCPTGGRTLSGRPRSRASAATVAISWLPALGMAISRASA